MSRHFRRRIRFLWSVLAVVCVCIGIFYGKRVYFYNQDTERRRQRITVERVPCQPLVGPAEVGIVVGRVALPLPGFAAVKDGHSWALVTDGARRYLVHTGPDVEPMDEQTLLAIRSSPPAFTEYLTLPARRLSERRLAMTTRAVFAISFPGGIQVVDCPDRRVVVGVGIGSITASLDSPSKGLRVSLLRQRDNIDEPLDDAIDQMVRALARAELAGSEGRPP